MTRFFAFRALVAAALAAAIGPASAQDKQSSDSGWLTERYSIELPKARPIDSARLVVAEIDPVGGVVLAGEKVRDEDLGPALRDRFKSGRYDAVVLRSDERADFARVMALLDVAKTSGFTRVGLETGAAPAPGRKGP